MIMISRTPFLLYRISSIFLYVFAVASWKLEVQIVQERTFLVLSSVPSYWFRTYSILGFVTVVFHNSFLIVKFVLKVHNGDSTSAIGLLWNLVCYFSPLIAYIQIWMKPVDLPVLINRFASFISKASMKARTTSNNGGCGPFMKAIISVAGLAIIQNFILMSKYPNREYYMTSLIPWGKPKLQRVVFVLQMWIYINAWAGVVFLAFTKCLYAYIGVALMIDFRQESYWDASNGMQRKHRFFQAVRNSISFEAFFKKYRAFEVLQKDFNSCFQDFWIPAHTCVFSAIFVLGSYGSIHLTLPKSLVMGVVACLAITYLNVMCRKLGMLNEESTLLIQSWTAKGSRRGAKALKSLKPIRVYVGGVNYVDKTTAFTVCGNVTNIAINTLLSV